MGVRYLGHGEFIPGVPARDLTAEEAARFGKAIAEHRRNTGRDLYGPPVPAEARPANKASKAPGGSTAEGPMERGDE
jgi:hypothetical protein